MPGTLRVGLADAAPCEDESLLAEVRFDTSSRVPARPRCWPLGLECLNQASRREAWFVRGVVEDVDLGLLSGSNSPHWAWLGAELPCPPQADVVSLTEQLFLQLHHSSAQLNKAHVARLWLIIPQIHAGEGDQGRYKKLPRRPQVTIHRPCRHFQGSRQDCCQSRCRVELALAGP